MIVDVFLRSYAADLPWAPWALRSIHRFVTGIRDVIISVPDEDYAEFTSLNLTQERLVVSQVATGSMDGYMAQQLDKLVADHYTDAEMLLYWDSDVVAIRPFSPVDLLIDGVPRCLMTPYSKLINADGSPATPWQKITEKAIGRPVAWEFMRSHPMLVHRDALFEFRDYMALMHDMTLRDYIAAQPYREFSEWNALHAWSFYLQQKLFSFWNTENEGVPEPFVKQFWSHGGLTPEIRLEMERLLA